MTEATIIDSSGPSFPAQIADYCRYRSLFWFLMVRDTKLRYRQTVLGISWAVLQPLVPMVIVTAVFARVLGQRIGDLPYWLFALAGMPPWNFFSSAVMTSSMTFVSNRSLLTKVYFPRAILPTAATAGCMLDLLVSTTFVLCISIVSGYPPRLTWLLLPPILAAGVCVAATVGLGLASLTAMKRDIRHALPFLVQVWMYATPVIYPLSVVPRHLQLAIGLNPMTGIVEAFRACIFGRSPDSAVLALSAISATALCALAVFLFFRLEADLSEKA